MKAVIQRVSQATVSVSGREVSKIEKGMMVLVGISIHDTDEDLEYLAGKISKLRIFDDEAGVMNLSISDISGSLLLVSQFTLMASTRKGNRPSYIEAAPGAISEPLFQKLLTRLKELLPIHIQTGIFGADMQVSLTNDGPVTIIIDSQNR